MSQSAIQVHAYTKQLARLMNFTPADIQYNRQGLLSESQKKQLRKKLNGYLILLSIVIVLFSVVTIGALFVIINQEQIAVSGASVSIDEGAIVLPMGFGLIVMVMVIIAFYMLANFNKDIAGGRVAHIVGRISRHRQIPEEDDQDFYIRIGAKKYWDVDSPLYEALQRNHVYIVYYTEKTNQLLAIEVSDPTITGIPNEM